MHKTTLHINISADLVQALKEISREKGVSLGLLVRQAVLNCYGHQIYEFRKKAESSKLDCQTE